METPAVLYRASTRAVAIPGNFPVPSYPLPDSCPIRMDAPQFDVSYQQAMQYFPPAPFNTPSSDAALSLGNANAILTQLTNQEFIAGGDIRFNATFNIVPASYDDFTKSIAFSFPGSPGLIGGGGRNTFTETVPLRQLREFFVLDPDNILSSAAPGGGPVNALSLLDSSGAPVKCVATLGDIPFIPKTQIVQAPSGVPEVHLFSQVVVQAGGVVIGNTGWYETLPTREAYYNLAVNAAAEQWNSVVWGGTNTIPTGISNPQAQLVALDSQIEPYAGNIVCRVTGYILAK